MVVRGRSITHTQKLLNAMISISRCATLEDALSPLLDAALDLTNMEGGGAYWVDGDVAVLRHHRGLPEAFINEVTYMPLSPLPVQKLMTLEKPIEIAKLSPLMRDLFDRHGIRHAFSFPLRAQETLFGFLNVGSTRSGSPHRSDIQALHVLVTHMESLFWRLYCEKAIRASEERYRQLSEHLELQVAERTEELTQRALQLQRLTAELSQAEEKERERLAQFLHDDLQQSLASARFHLSLLNKRTLPDETLIEIADEVGEMLRDAMEKSRTLSHELIPPALYHGNLNKTFEWLVHHMNRKHGLFTRLEIQGQVDTGSEPVRILLYRASQEILFNIVKHSGVSEAELRLQRVGGELLLTISDNGRGFDPSLVADTAGFGLMHIRERVELLGGGIRIKSTPGRGSTVRIVLPDKT